MASTLRRDDTDQNIGGTTLSATFTDASDHATTAITATGASDYVDMASADTVAIEVTNGATNSATFTVEGSLSGAVWVTLATRADSSASYAKTGVTVTGGSSALVFLNSADLVRYVRVNLSAANANGTTFTLFGRST